MARAFGRRGVRRVGRRPLAHEWHAKVTLLFFEVQHRRQKDPVAAGRTAFLR